MAMSVFPSTNRRRIFTLGHSTRSLDELIGILKHYGIKALVDVRRFPRSRRNPQFNRETLEALLPAGAIRYRWLEGLGGYREGGYEEYMETDEFREGLEMLLETANREATAVMCAELLWFRCHRRFIASLLSGRGWEVIHIYDEKRAQAHRLP